MPPFPLYLFPSVRGTLRHGESAGTNRSVYIRALTVRDKSQATKNGTLTRTKKKRVRKKKMSGMEKLAKKEKKFSSPFHDGRAMDSRIAALRAHVKERGTSNSKAGSTLTFYIRSGPVRAVSVAVSLSLSLPSSSPSSSLSSRTHRFDTAPPSHTHVHTYSGPAAARYTLRECLRRLCPPRSVIVVALVVGLPQPPQVLRSTAAARWKFEISHVGWPRATGRKRKWR